MPPKTSKPFSNTGDELIYLGEKLQKQAGEKLAFGNELVKKGKQIKQGK